MPSFYCAECGAPMDDPASDLCYECEALDLCIECGAPASFGEDYCSECQVFLDEDIDELLDEDDEQFLRGEW